MANTYLQRTNQTADWIQNFSISIWFKKSKTGDAQYIYSNYQDANNRAYINILNDDRIYIYDREGGYDRQEMTSNFKLRDTNAWYHIFFWCHARGGGSGGSLNDRVKFYVNGVDRINDFSIVLPYGYNADSGFQTGTLSNGNRIGSDPNGNNTFDGSMSHIHFLDNQPTYDVDSFGETDATTGEWKIKTDVSVTYGTNGFFILKDGNSVTDQSGNGNNFTVGGGTLTNTEDCPSNVFNTLSPIDKPVNSSGSGASIPDLSNGNLTITNTNSAFREVRSNFYVSTGKYYFEAKPTRIDGSGAFQVGVVARNYSQGSGERRAYQNNGNKYVSNSSSYGATFTANDIIGVALNLDDGEITFYKNGVSQGVAVTDMLSGIDDTGWTPAVNCYDADGHLNFGNGYFGTTAVSTPGTNASGNGIFEYDVPTGYTALSTKGLNL